MTFRPDAFVAAAVLCACGAAPAASLQGVFTADDFATVYLSTDLVAESGEVIVDKATTWQTMASFADVALAQLGGESVELMQFKELPKEILRIRRRQAATRRRLARQRGDGARMA